MVFGGLNNFVADMLSLHAVQLFRREADDVLRAVAR